jgi:uncharacterized protein YjbI with pentapeptide repeats
LTEFDFLAQLIETDLSYADLFGANLEEDVLSRAGLNKASLVGVRAKGAKADLTGPGRAWIGPISAPVRSSEAVLCKSA